MTSIVNATARALTLCALVLLSSACGDRPTATEPPPTELPDPPPITPAPAAAAIPTLDVTTDGGAPIVSRDDYLTGSYRLVGADSVLLLSGPLEIRGRGNSTWVLLEKKPYRLKFGSSAAVLGMPTNRHWVLLANHSDKTLMRNDVVFELSRMLGMAYTPRTEYVHLTLNGAYQGLYQLGEHIRIGSSRVNVPELRIGDTTAALITGGYLLEVDERRGEAFCFNSTRTPMVFCAKSPETLLDAGWERQRAYITSYMQRVDDAIFSPQFADSTLGYASLLDVGSMIDYYLINEVVKNVDGDLRLSTFLYKPRDGKLFFGPVWDFDIAIGNVNYGVADRTSGWHVRTAAWFTRLFQDPVFNARVKSRWQQMQREGMLTRLQGYITARESYLRTAQTRNFERWPILGSYVWPNRIVTGSYAGEVSEMKNWLAGRTIWMDAELSRP